ncbi:uncharacterized protein LOC106646709 [Copidosoma floridanum]|uniref:uncharacterized protein LOC106646709 n=1 Tax=Copidosoma floridanum TaxID=29053 RepID=UPI0006C9E219|nr:uncharacterized protein LOC106646709 [Copidosoma floridanum]
MENKPPWTKAKSSKFAEARRQRARPEAIIVKIAEIKMYAEVLALMKRVNVFKLGAGVGSNRETRSGSVLVKLRDTTTNCRDAFTDALKNAVAGAGGVRTLSPRLTYEIRDVDPTVTEQDVQAALRRCFEEEKAPVMAVRLLSGTVRGNQVTYVEAPATETTILNKMDHMRLSWVNCRIRLKSTVECFFKCLSFGHIARQCGEPDRTGVGWRYDGRNHVVRNYSKKEVSCYLVNASSLNRTPNSPLGLPGIKETLIGPYLRINLLDQLARVWGVDLLFKNKPSHTSLGQGWYYDRMKCAASLIRSDRLSISDTGGRDGIMWIRCERRLAKLEDAVHVCGANGNVVLVGDYNFKAIAWREPRTDSRGQAVIEFAARLDLIVMNSGSSATFRQPSDRGTIIDLTLISSQMVAWVSDWQVLKNYTASNHQYLSFEAMVSAPPPIDLSKILNTAEVEALISGTMRRVKEWCNACMPKRFARKGQRSCYWWTKEIAYLHGEAQHLQRLSQRHRTCEDVEVAVAAYRNAKKALVRAIKVSKNRRWHKLIAETAISCFFPEHPDKRWKDMKTGQVSLFTLNELRSVASKTLGQKASGPDRVPSEVLKVVAVEKPNFLLDMFNACLGAGLFSDHWKI